MKQSSILLSLLGDFYQTVGSNYLSSGVDELYSNFMYEKYNNIINKYMAIGDIGSSVITSLFIKKESYLYDGTFLIVDISGEPFIGKIFIIRKEKILNIESAGGGRYIIAGELKDDVTNSDSSFVLIQAIVGKVSDDPTMSVLKAGFSNSDLASDVIDFIRLKNESIGSTVKSLMDISNIIIGSPYCTEKEEVIISINNGTIRTDSHIYTSEYSDGLTAFSAGDTVYMGDPFYALVNLVQPDSQIRNIRILDRIISSNLSNMQFLNKLKKYAVKSSCLIEVAEEVMISSSRESLSSLSAISGLSNDKKIVFTGSRISIEDSFNHEEKDSMTEKQITSAVGRSETYLEAILVSLGECIAESGHTLYIEETMNIVSDEEYRNRASVMKDSSIAHIADNSTTIVRDTSNIEYSEGNELSGHIGFVSIGGVSDKMSIINRFDDTFSFDINNENVSYLISDIIENTANEYSSGDIVNVVYSIAISESVPIFNSVTSSVASASEDISYDSKLSYSESVSPMVIFDTVVGGDSSISAVDYSISEIADTSIVSSEDNMHRSGNVSDYIGIFISDNLLGPVITSEDSVTVVDYAFIDGDTQIDF